MRRDSIPTRQIENVRVSCDNRRNAIDTQSLFLTFTFSAALITFVLSMITTPVWRDDIRAD